MAQEQVANMRELQVQAQLDAAAGKADTTVVGDGASAAEVAELRDLLSKAEKNAERFKTRCDKLSSNFKKKSTEAAALKKELSKLKTLQTMGDSAVAMAAGKVGQELVEKENAMPRARGLAQRPLL